MNEYNQEQIATEIAELLNSDHFLDALMGKTGGAQSGGSLVVRSNGRQVSAIAVGEVPPGDCVALRDTNTGQWYAVSSYDEGKNDDHLIRYRKWRQPDDNDIVLPVKTIFAIYSNATRTTTFYLGGDRTSEKIDEVKNIRFDNAHIRNLGGNKFFAYSMYVDSADIFRLKINKDSTSNPVDYDYKWSVDNDYKWGNDNSLDIYTGINLDTTSYQLINDNKKFPTRNIYLKDQEIKVRNLTLMTETEIKRGDSSVLATDYSYEIETVRNNGDISITTFEIKTTLISSEKFTPFRSFDYRRISHEVSSYLTSFDFGAPIRMGEKDVTINVAVNRIGEQKPYAYEYEETRDIASWKTGFYNTRLIFPVKRLIDWTKRLFLVFYNPPDQEFGISYVQFWDDEEDPVGNPPPVTGITSYISAMVSPQRYSTTRNSISEGSKTFTYPANSNLPWSVNFTVLRAYNTADNTSYIEGLVTAVSSTSVTISASPDKVNSPTINAGSGTFASWNITSSPNVYPYDDLFSSPYELVGQFSSLTLPNNQIIKNINFFARYIDYRKNKRKKDMDDSLTTPTSITETIPNFWGHRPGTKITIGNQSITWNGNVFTKITNFHEKYDYFGIINEPVFDYLDWTTTDTCVIDEGDPQYLDYIKKTCKVKGINTIFNCVNGEIIQDFEGDIEQYGGWQLGEKGTKDPYIDERTFKSVPNFYIKKEIKNEIKLIYDDKKITLNNGDFGLLDLKKSNTVVVSSINKETTVFTITYTNAALRLVKNINYADFTGDVFNGNFIMAWEIEGKPCLIKGTCTKSYNKQSQVLKISCTVENIKVNTPSSFPKTFIIDNGSYYAYCFRKNTNIYSKLWYSENNSENNSENSGSTQVDPEISGVYFPRVSLQGERCETLRDNSENFSEILSKEIFNFIPLSHHLWAVLLDQVIFDDRKIICRILGEYDNVNSHLAIHTTDNIVRNKIYSVAKTDKNKAWVEQWDILENGNVKYKKVFQVDYVPLKNEGEKIFAHSYYPE